MFRFCNLSSNFGLGLGVGAGAGILHVSGLGWDRCRIVQEGHKDTQFLLLSFLRV